MSRPRSRAFLPFVLVPLLALLLAGCGSSSGDTTTAATSTTAAGSYGKGPTVSGLPNPLKSLRDARYCEIIPVTREKNVNKAEIYNTIGLNNCPPEKWNAITEDAVNKAYGSNQAKLNGPRFWVLDELSGEGNTTGGASYVFNGIEMAKRAGIETKLREATVGGKFYEPNTVHRETVWHYHAGTKVYELTAPDGAIYTMQSYSQIKDKTLTIGELDHLGSKLQLPEGWQYSVRTLTSPLALKAEGTAYVINDDLYDSYQRRYAPPSH